MINSITGTTNGKRHMEFSLFQRSQPRDRQPFWSTNFTSQAAAMNTAIDRISVNLSGSKTRDECMLKNRGVITRAASQPASINPSHQRESLDSIFFDRFYCLISHFNVGEILPQRHEGSKDALDSP